MSDLNLQERQLKVRGKGDKERLVPFGSDCGEILLRYTSVYRNNAKQNVGNIFISLDGESLTRDSLEKIFQRLKESSGVKNLRPHVLRHTFAYNYLLGGGSVVDLQVIMGHNSIETTMIYVRHYQMKNVAKYSKVPSPVDRMNLRRKTRFGFKRQPKPKIT
jgi:site-specific recombinase XerD